MPALRPSLTRYAWLSIAAAIATILLKGVAWKLTGSVGLLSDAIESFVNLAGAIMALWMLTLAALPADDAMASNATAAVRVPGKDNAATATGT
ncbi:MAG: cation transporter, partial [Sterolibacterium sp.]